MIAVNTPWLDRTEYPFDSHFIDLPAGRMHYVDEGQSNHAIVMVHGNPTWSFVYRHLIKGLSRHYRCIAPDHIGFGLSDKPSGFDYLPESHAENLKYLLNELNLESVTLVVQDWGGPTGLSYAVEYPEKIKSIVIMNTWCWSVKGNKHFERFSGYMGSALGRFLIKRMNLFVRFVMKQAYGDKSKLTKNIHRHYLKALGSPQDREGCSVFPKRIIGSSEWLASLWEQRDKFSSKPAIILWGKKDIAFRQNELDVWKDTLSNATVHEFANVGHYVQEELGPALCPFINEFAGKHLEQKT